MKVCVVGGGHIGTTLVCYIKNVHPEFEVTLYTRRPELFSDTLRCNDIEQNITYFVQPDLISNDAKLAITNADIVFIALPHFAIEQAFTDIAPYVLENVKIGVLPGGGGCEFIFSKYFDSNKTLFGFQRVPFTAKLVEYGKETNLKSWKPFSVVGTLQRNRVDEVCDMVERCGLRTKKASNYLEIALTPTNPILHTSRTYEIFGDYELKHKFDSKLKFYVGWGRKASETLFAMDAELHALLDAIEGLDTSAIRPLSEHYESLTIDELSVKINSIATFQSVYAPMREVEDGYVSDTNSRMFTEDFPWGLAVIRSYFEYFNIPAPTMDRVLMWYSEYMGLEWYVDGKFIGKDLKYTGIIQNYGFKTKEDLLKIYM